MIVSIIAVEQTVAGLPRTEVFSLIIVALVAAAFTVAAVTAWRREHQAARRSQAAAEAARRDAGARQPLCVTPAQWAMERR
jgi:hypothetical protein